MEIKQNIITFDFDGTLADHFNGDANTHQKATCDWVKRMRRRGYEIHIVTRRYGPDNSALGAMDEHIPVLKKAKQLGIPEERVHFTARKWKYEKLRELGTCLHIDDDTAELFWILKNTPSIKGILVGSNNWEDRIIKTLSSHDSWRIWLSNEDNVVKLGTGLVIFLLATITFLSR